MKLNKLLVFATFINILTAACDSCDTVNSNAYTQINNIKYLPDSDRQKDIEKDYLKDNFNFDQFKDVDWNDVATYGATKSLVTDNKNDYALDEERSVFFALGAQKNDYKIVRIAGDGNCWMRAAIQQALFLILNDEDKFNAFVSKIPVIKEDFKDVPGFEHRFLANDLITLLTKLKSLAPKERLASFNKDKVDTFLQYIFRTLLAATVYKFSVPDEQKEKYLKISLTMAKWGDAKDIAYVLQLFLDEDFYIPDGDLESIFSYKGKNMIGEIFSDNKKVYLDDDELDNDNKNKILAYPTVQVVPLHTGGNHFNLLVHKNSAAKFGL